jgi:hypothetical protein
VVTNCPFVTHKDAAEAPRDEPPPAEGGRVTDERYTATAVVRTCDANPSQWQIKALPRPLSIRYRWGKLTVQIDEGDSSEELLSLQIGDALDEYMSDEDMMKHTTTLIDWSRVR